MIDPGTAAGLAKAAWPLVRKLAASDEFTRLCVRLSDRFGEQTGYSAASFGEWRENDAFMVALAVYLSPPYDFRRDALISAITPLVGPVRPGGSAEEFAGEVADAIRDEAIQAKEGDDLVRFVLAQLSEHDSGPLAFARLFRVPLPRNPLFRGRDALLEDIRSGLRAPGRRIALTQVLAGSGGFGKTQTALEYAYRFADDYVVVWWISARDESGIRQGLFGLSQCLGLRCDSEELGVGACRQWLLEHPAWLLVLDNAVDPELVERYLPTGAGHVITTSRRQDWANAEVAILDVLNRSDAVELLVDRATDDDREAAAELADELGCLPLAVEQAGALIASTSTLALRSYLDLYRRRYVDLWGRGRASFYDQTVATTWLLSFESVADSPAARLLEACALLDPDGAQLGLFEHARADALPELADEIDRLDAIRDLRRHSLARPSVDNRWLVMHRLIGAQVRARLDQSRLRTLVAALGRLIVREASTGADAARTIIDQALSVCRYSMGQAPEAAFALIVALMENEPPVRERALMRLGLECADAMAGEGSAKGLPMLRELADQASRINTLERVRWLERILEREQRHSGPGSQPAVLAHLDLADAYRGLSVRDTTRYTAHLELASVILRRRPFAAGIRRLHEIRAQMALDDNDIGETCRHWWLAIANSETDRAQHDLCMAAGRALVKRKRLGHARRFLEHSRGLESEGVIIGAARDESARLLAVVYGEQWRFERLCELCAEQLDALGGRASAASLARGWWLNNLARARARNGDPDGALEAYTKGVAWFEDSCRAHHMCGLGGRPRHEAPEVLLERIVGEQGSDRKQWPSVGVLTPDLPPLFCLGITHLLGVAQAERAWALADDLRSGYASPDYEALIARVSVDVSLARGQLDHAVATANSPTLQVATLIRVAEVHRLAGDAGRARETLHGADSLVGHLGAATCLALGKAHRGAGDMSGARQFAELALTRRADDVVRSDILLELASLLAASGEIQNALRTALDARFLSLETFGDDAPRVAAVVELAECLCATAADGSD